METTNLDIFSYENFRVFLEDYYNEQKQKYPSKFSFRFFSKQAGFNTSNFLHLVIKGKRNISYDSINKIAKVLQLRGRKYDYFESLVFFNQAENSLEKTKHYEKLVSFKEYQDARLISDTQKLYFSKWYYPVIREMVKLPFFKSDPKWIASQIQPNIKPHEAREAMDILLKLNLIQRHKTGKWLQSDSQLKTKNQGVSHEVVAYHRKMIHLGFESLNQSSKNRDISGITMSISPAKYKLIKKKIASFRDEIQSIIKQPLNTDNLNDLFESNISKTDKNELLNISQVCQLNFQFFKIAGKGSDID